MEGGGRATSGTVAENNAGAVVDGSQSRGRNPERLRQPGVLDPGLRRDDNVFSLKSVPFFSGNDCQSHQTSEYIVTGQGGRRQSALHPTRNLGMGKAIESIKSNRLVVPFERFIHVIYSGMFK